MLSVLVVVLQLVVAIVAVSVTSLVLYVKWCFTFWEKRNVFTFPPSLPYGNAKEVFRAKKSLSFSLAALYREARSRGLKYAGYYFIGQTLFLPVDIELIRTILVKDFQHFTDHSMMYINEETDPLTGHLFAQKGAKWKALRTKLTPTFSSGKLKYMFPTLVDCTKDLPSIVNEAMGNNEPFDAKDTFARFTTDVIGSCAFGIDCNCLKNPDTEFRKFGRKIFEIKGVKRFKRRLAFVALSVFKFLKLRFIDQDVEEFFINVVSETIDYRDKNKMERKDFMQLLMELRHKELKVEPKLGENGTGYYQNGLSNKEIAAQAFAFFAAGFETTSTTLTFLMYELAIQPKIQEKLRDEINRVLENHDGSITYDAVNEMTYLDKCFQETLRKYPPVATLPRLCTKMYRVPDSDLVLEKDTKVLISAYAIHHDPEFYPDPERFDPERFSEENKTSRPPMTFLAFGEGPRTCIGLRFGLLQAKVGMVVMLRHFRFSLNPKTKNPLEFEPQPILTVKGGVWIDAERV